VMNANAVVINATKQPQKRSLLPVELFVSLLILFIMCVFKEKITG
jgi:hypothetical protein